MTFIPTNIFITSCVAVLLTACASDYAFNSNLDSKVIKDYFKASDVKLYEANSLPKGKYDVLGLVEGEACQENSNDAPPKMAEARTSARRAAADLGANGLIVKSCFMINEQDNSCVSRALCVGQAIKTPVTKQ